MRLVYRYRPGANHLIDPASLMYRYMRERGDIEPEVIKNLSRASVGDNRGVIIAWDSFAPAIEGILSYELIARDQWDKRYQSLFSGRIIDPNNEPLGSVRWHRLDGFRTLDPGSKIGWIRGAEEFSGDCMEDLLEEAGKILNVGMWAVEEHRFITEVPSLLEDDFLFRELPVCVNNNSNALYVCTRNEIY